MTVWRTIPDFPTYEVTDDGDVRNRKTKYVLNEIHNPNTGAYSYCLWKDGKSYHRNFWTLIYNAWPELKPADKWRTHPTYEGYEVSRDGEVRHRRTRYVLRPRLYKGHTEPKVRLRIDGKRIDQTTAALVAETYPEGGNA